MYHAIEYPPQDAGAQTYCVKMHNFREQMELIKQGQSPAGTVPVITFDDGDITNYTKAYPVLKELGLKAYFFILASNVGKANYMNWEQIKKLSNAGMIIGSHGMTHHILTSLKADDLAFEVEKSKQIIEEKINSPVEYFSVPKGYYNKRVIDAVKKAGYKKMFTSDLDKNNEFIFGRIAVKAYWTKQYFKQVITKGVPLKGRVVDNIKKNAKKLFGNSFYHNLREAILSKNGKEK